MSSDGDSLLVSVGRRLKPFVPPILYDRAKEVLLHRDEPERYKRVVGGMWEEIGTLQAEFLIERGLERSDTLLDVGCGTLRGGVHFVEYLDEGNYYGVDVDRWKLAEAKRTVLPENDLEDANVTLGRFGDFGFDRFGETFDYAVAQSVFTHLPLNAIVRCLVNVEAVLEDGGEFYATFFETDEPYRLDPKRHDPGGITTNLDSDPYHYGFEVFEDVCTHLDHLDVEYVGDWDHPRDQKMLLFSR